MNDLAPCFSVLDPHENQLSSCETTDAQASLPEILSSFIVDKQHLASNKHPQMTLIQAVKEMPWVS